MPINYTDLQARARTLLAANKTGVVTIKRRLSSLQDASEAYDPPTITYDVYTLAAVVFGVTDEYVNDTVSWDDLNVTTSPVATLAGSPVSIVPQMGDELSIDGETHRIKKIEQVPAAGTPVIYMIFVAR